jgi:hypothetical protein
MPKQVPTPPPYPKPLKGPYQDIDDIGMNPYGNHAKPSNQLQEFHYSGSFGVPGTF